MTIVTDIDVEFPGHEGRLPTIEPTRSNIVSGSQALETSGLTTPAIEANSQRRIGLPARQRALHGYTSVTDLLGYPTPNPDEMYQSPGTEKKKVEPTVR